VSQISIVSVLFANDRIYKTMATAEQLDNKMECPICTEVYMDPRVLPCAHTYCLKCIETWSKEKQPGHRLACPLCRKEFTVPSSGAGGLPKNLYIDSILQTKELSTAVSKLSLCEACSGDEVNHSEVPNVASVYCVECQLKLCNNCERVHKVIKVVSSHKLIEVGSRINMDSLCHTLPSSFCDHHKDERLKFYCFDCGLTICMMCYINSHNGHKCSDVNEAVCDLHKQMTHDIDRLTAGLDKCKEMLDILEKVQHRFIEQVERVGVEINKKAEQLKRMIDVHKEKLINELSSMKQKRMKEIESLRDEIETQSVLMESYKKYVEEVRQKGTACDIARAASGLHDRAEELLLFVVDERALADLSDDDVTFTSSIFVDDAYWTALGELKLKPAGIILFTGFLSLL